MAEEKKKRNFFSSVSRIEKKRAEDRIRTKPGEKTEEEIRQYGWNFGNAKIVIPKDTHQEKVRGWKARVRKDILNGIAKAKRDGIL